MKKVALDKARKIGGKAFLILAGGIVVVGLALYVAWEFAHPYLARLFH